MLNTFVSFNLSAFLVLVCTTLAVAAPQNIPAPTITPTPSVPTPIATICVNIDPSIINCVNPILSVGADGIAVGGVGYHNVPGVLSEHGNGALTVGTGGVGVVLTQTFSVLGAVVSYGLGLSLRAESDFALTPAPTPTSS